MAEDKEFEKRDVKLYGITGWFSDQPSQTAVAFGGYFRYDALENLVYDGQLIDCYGPSNIAGRMAENTLEFVKKYNGRKNLINYKFSKNNDIWIGEWSMTYSEEINEKFGRTGGESQCSIYLVKEDAWNIRCGALRNIRIKNIEDLLNFNL